MEFPFFQDALAALQSDTILKELQEKGLTWHRTQYEALMKAPQYQALSDELTGKKEN
jgi:hypothetical protein